MTAVQVGAGNIGRGFLGQLFFEAGWDIVFIDANPDLVNLLNERGSYPIEVVEPREVIEVSGFRALVPEDPKAVQAIAEADLVSSAVGANVLPKVAPLLASGISQRLDQDSRPLDILLAENLHDAAMLAKEWVRAGLPPRQWNFEDRIGFVECSIGRMVPRLTEAERLEDPLRIRVEAYKELPVDAEAFRGPIPKIPNLLPTTGFAAYVERKLFLHNAGHAVAAYLGHRQGHETLAEAMEDPKVRGQVELAMEEASLALHLRHGLDLDELRAHAVDLRRRIGSRTLGDTVRRVASDPVRKLARNDRLVGAIRMCLETGVDPQALARAAMAALTYLDPEDPSAKKLARLREEQGDREALVRVTGLRPDDPAIRRILDAKP